MFWAWLGALLIGISLGLLGSGGSILTVPVLIYLVDQPEKVAIAESLGIVASISLFGAIPYAYRKEIDWKSVLWFGVPGMIGTYGGASISEFISGNTQLIIFGIVMLLAAFLMVKDNPRLKKEKGYSAPRYVLIAEGLIVGVVTGLVGVGGGFLIIPALVLFGGLKMRIAIGTSLAIIAAKSFLGFYKYLDVLRAEKLNIDWELLLIFTVIGIAGSLLGGRLSKVVPQKMLKKGFGVFLIGMSGFILWNNLF
ncbi:MAG: sulfite exporter TauE/SafE family protein [Balneolaceae bacterium]|nr:sulfite exporter TauE/SafE family protein [Balneolaceae bacterium]MBO6547919.1 sulfite exporter TauE/SafE family protein [Balneolaceae bacterium]MBO6648432.1 sulfite exporter TauE/SafE family protein [Balneolaceae bacterium]